MSILLMAAAVAATNIVVEASRIGSTSEEMPAEVQVITRGEIAASGARDLPELLEKVAHLPVHHLNANPLQSSVSMGGFGENGFGRTKVLLDGEVLNNVDMEAPDLSRVALGLVDRVEVIHGPSPVLHGDGAEGGVIDVVTMPADSTRHTKITAKGGSFNTFGVNLVTRGGSETNGTQYAAGYDYARSDGYRDRSGYQLHNVGAAVRQNFANGAYIGVRANYQNALYELPGSLSYAGWKHSRRTASYDNDWVRAWAYGLSLESKAKLAEDQWLYTDFGFSAKHRRANWGDYGYANEYDTYSYYLAPRYVNEVGLGDFDNRLTLGTDLRYDDYRVHNNSGWGAAKWRFGRLRTAAYIHDAFYLTDELSIEGGARLENIRNRYYRYQGLARDHNHNWQQGYELGLVYRPIAGTKIYVKGTRFYRSAFVDESNYTEDGNPLRPEHGYEIDAGIEARFFKEFTFDFNGYWNQIEDEIFYNPYVTDYGYGYWGGYNQNSPAPTRRAGADMGVSWRRDRVAEASVRYAIVNAEFASGAYHGKKVPLVPNHRVRAEAGVWLWDEFEVKGGCSFVSSQRLAGDFANRHDRLPCYVVFDIGAYYRPIWAEGLEIGFTMDNLLDRNYCDFAGWSDYSGAYYYPAAGRSFMFTISYAW